MEVHYCLDSSQLDIPCNIIDIISPLSSLIFGGDFRIRTLLTWLSFFHVDLEMALATSVKSPSLVAIVGNRSYARDHANRRGVYESRSTN